MKPAALVQTHPSAVGSEAMLNSDNAKAILLELAAQQFLYYCAVDDLCRLAISCPLFYSILSSPDDTSKHIWRNAYKGSKNLERLAKFRQLNYPVRESLRQHNTFCHNMRLWGSLVVCLCKTINIVAFCRCAITTIIF